MAPREDLVASAISFLQDPSVASSPIEKRIEFLKSKNLTQEEIDTSLAQAGSGSSPSTSQPSPSFNTSYYPQQQQYRNFPPQGYNPNNNNYSAYGAWQQPPPEPPRRDWRDWFIMATAVGGAGYGFYVLAQRYIKPLIAPPTPPQLEQDKAAIDDQFNRAFALLDTLAQDTEVLKQAEQARTIKLDAAITDIETIVADLKAANLKREDDSRRMEAEVKSMKDGLPRAIDSVREGSERQLKELSTELASLKALMTNRMGGSTSSNPMFNSSSGAAATGGVMGQAQNLRSSDATSAGMPSSSAGISRAGNTIPNSLSLPDGALGSNNKGSNTSNTGANGIANNTLTSIPTFIPSSNAGASTGTSAIMSPYTPSTSTTPSLVAASTSNTAAAGTTPKPSFTKSTSIPAWQMTAQNKVASTPSNNATTSSTTTTSSQPQQDGADAVATLMGSSHNN